MSVRHLDEEQVQRLLHGELTAPASTAVRDHLDVCDECRSRVDESVREETRVLELMERLDHESPAMDARTVMRRRRRSTPALGRLAASIALIVAVGGVAYAAPGSPVRAAVRRLIPWFAGSDVPRQPARTPNVVSPPSGPDRAVQGVAVAPGDRFLVVFSSPASGAVAAVTFTDGPDLSVRAVGGRATFTSDVDRLSITEVKGTTRFEIEVPRAAPRVEIWVAGRRVLSKTVSGVVTEGQRDAGGYLVPLSGGPSS